jgi:hypothetical protein
VNGESFHFHDHEDEDEDDDWEEPPELTPTELNRLREENSRDRSQTPAARGTNADENLEGPDFRRLLEDVGIRKITYNILKPGNIWFYDFEIPIGLSWNSFRNTLLTELKIDQAVQDAAEFQFSLNSATSKWFGVKDDKTWSRSVLKAIFTNFEDRTGAGASVRKKKTKEALPLTVKVVSSSPAFHALSYSDLLLDRLRKVSSNPKPMPEEQERVMSNEMASISIIWLYST